MFHVLHGRAIFNALNMLNLENLTVVVFANSTILSKHRFIIHFKP
jgi:hypothetical protein